MILDTHIFLWMNEGPEKLAKKIRTLIESPETLLYLSAASALEISMKCSIKKLYLPSDAATYVHERVASNNLLSLPITLKHGLMAGSFSAEHRDPFDRLLAAQAIIEEMPILTVDRKFEQFPCTVIWAS